MTAPAKNKQEAVRIAIALHLGAKWWLFDSGWTRLSFKDLSEVGGFVLVDAPKDPAKVFFSDTVPDYCNDLNAIVDACRKLITDEDYGMFEHHMCNEIEAESQESYVKFYFASPMAYCLALCQTLGINLI